MVHVHVDRKALIAVAVVGGAGFLLNGDSSREEGPLGLDLVLASVRVHLHSIAAWEEHRHQPPDSAVDVHPVELGHFVDLAYLLIDHRCGGVAILL